MKHTIARSIAMLLIFVITLLPPQSGLAQQGGQANPHLVKNINAAVSEGSSPRNFMPVEAVTYFFANQGGGRFELWKTDGTPAGTAMVKDGMRPGGNSYAVMNNFLYYPAYDTQHGQELWRTNLTTGETGLFADIEYGDYSSNPNRLTEFEGKIYFSANWDRFQSTDGTPEGTTHNGLDGEVVTSPFIAYKNSLYYSAYQWDPVSDNKTYYMRWFGSGGSGVTTGLNPRQPLIVYKDRLYFTASRTDVGMELWSTGGTAESIQLLHDIHPGDTYIYSAAEYNGKLYFVTVDDTNVNELWVTNGTEAGTTKVTNLPEAAAELRIITALPSQSAEHPGGLLLSFNQGSEENYELWSFNGTNFTALADLRGFTTDNEYDAESGYVANGWYYFHAWDANHGVELWRTDGTPGSTVLIKDIYPGMRSSMASLFTPCGSRVCFSANDGTHGTELWQTDGTAVGTTMVKDLNTQAAGAFPTDFISAGDFAYFQAADAISVKNLWRTDGTASGTFPLNLDPTMNLRQLWQDVGPLRVLLDTNLIFAAEDPVHGNELWKSDGTPGGTKLLKDLLPGKESSNPMQMTVAGNRVFFITRPNSGESNLWVTDGTLNGTKIVPVKAPTTIAAYENSVVINIPNTTNWNCELWLINEPASPAVKVSDNLCLSKALSFDGKLYIAGKEAGASEEELWVMNGSSSGIQKIPLDISPAGYYDSYSVTHLAATGSDLYVFVFVYDGQFLLRIPSGGGPSQFVKAFYSVNGVPARANDPIPFGDDLIIQISMYMEGYQWGVTQLWVTDGTTNGTRRVQGDYRVPAVLMQSGNGFFFSYVDSERRTQIWRMDVHNATAKPVSYLPQTQCAAPNALPAVPLFFSEAFLLPLDDAKSNPPGSGCELWAYEILTTKLFLPSVGR